MAATGIDNVGNALRMTDQGSFEQIQNKSFNKYSRTSDEQEDHQLDRQRVEDLLALNFTISQIARILNVGRTTMYKKMQEQGISYDDRYSHISDKRLREVIEDIRRDHVIWVKL